MKIDIIIIGAGGHAKVLVDCLLQQSQVNLLGLLDAGPALAGQKILGVPVLGNDTEIKNYSPNKIRLVNAVGSIDIPTARKNIFYRFKALGYQFMSVIHPNAYIARCVKLGEGSQVMAGAIIQPDCVIGENTIINTGASIDHDCQIADHTHIAPGVVISGNVHIEEESHIGVHATILQGLKIGKKSLVGAGAVVIHSLKPGSRVIGVPAKEIQTIREEVLDEGLE